MDLKKTIQKNNFHFNKRYGQNFIEDTSLLEKIVDAAQITSDDVVLEIGVGAGTLTKCLAKRAKYVVGYEIDKNLAPVLSETLAGVDNAEVVFRDFMREKVENVQEIVGDRFIVVANLPYYITSPITMRLLEEFKGCQRLVIMVQKEVALRFTAKAGSKDYGSITAAIDYYGDSEYMFTVTRDNFYPVPNVDSAVVKIDRVDKYNAKSERAFKETLRIAFLSRRKTLVNNLINNLPITRAQAESILMGLNLDTSIRGEVLSTAQFIDLSNVLFEQKIIE